MPYWAYVSNDGSNEIQVIDLAAGEELTRIPVPPGPFGLALTPDGTQLWVPLDVSRSVAIIDTTTGALFRSVELPDDSLLDVAIHPDGKTAYLLSGRGVLYAMDVASTEVTGVLGIGGEQVERMRLTPDGTELWIADEANGAVAIVDTGLFRVVGRVEAGQTAADIAFTPDNRLALVADLTGGHIHLVNRADRKVVDSIDLEGGMPRSVAVGPDGDPACITLYESDRVLVLDLAEGQIVSEFGGCFDGPNGLSVAPDGSVVVVVSQMSSAVCLIDLKSGSEIRTLPFPGMPRRVVIGEAPVFERVGRNREGATSVDRP